MKTTKKREKLMAVKKKVETETQFPVQKPELCGAWAFVLGASLAAFCRLAPNHDGDHRTEINVLAEPRSHFTITWSLDD